MKKYALVQDNSVRFLDLRETPKYLINDQSGTRYKKVEGKPYLAEWIDCSGRWRSHHYKIYDVDSSTTIEKVKEIKEKLFIKNVAAEMAAMSRKIGSLDEANRINKALSLGVEL